MEVTQVRRVRGIWYITLGGETLSVILPVYNLASTIAANLAVSCAMSGRKVLLIDGDMRRACQREIFRYSHNLSGLSEVLIGAESWQNALFFTSFETLQVMPAGQLPPNPAELLESSRMKTLLHDVSDVYDLILVDTPPINIAADPLALSDEAAGCLFITRQYFSDPL